MGTGVPVISPIAVEIADDRCLVVRAESTLAELLRSAADPPC
jgi:hypothetical protein